MKEVTFHELNQFIENKRKICTYFYFFQEERKSMKNIFKFPYFVRSKIFQDFILLIRHLWTACSALCRHMTCHWLKIPSLVQKFHAELHQRSRGATSLGISFNRALTSALKCYSWRKLDLRKFDAKRSCLRIRRF